MKRKIDIFKSSSSDVSSDFYLTFRVVPAFYFLYDKLSLFNSEVQKFVYLKKNLLEKGREDSQ